MLEDLRGASAQKAELRLPSLRGGCCFEEDDEGVGQWDEESGKDSMVNKRVLPESGAVSKLCLLLQLDCSSKTKQKTKDVLKLHGKRWSTSRCFPLHFKQYFDK